jgi:hypothetical protein
MTERHLEPQQILGAFDDHFEKFNWRIADIKDRVEAKAYRQLIATLQSENNSLKGYIRKLEYVSFKAGLKLKEHPAWADKVPDDWIAP